MALGVGIAVTLALPVRHQERIGHGSVQVIRGSIEAVILPVDRRASAAVHLFDVLAIVAHEARLALGVVVAVPLTVGEGEEFGWGAVVADEGEQGGGFQGGGGRDVGWRLGADGGLC